MVKFKETHSNDKTALVYANVEGDCLRRVDSPGTTFTGRSFIGLLRQVLLPEGYPDSVSSDYLEYQTWDTIQAFASSITGSLATAAVLRGVGVGDSQATPIAATITWILKDGAGMVGRIVFAAYSGTSLDNDCKRWRMFADVLNDFVMMVELVAPYLPLTMMLTLCLAGVGRSLVGVAGGATKAAVAQHQARRNNMADLSAKDGSQETMVNLLALCVNLMILPLVTDSPYITSVLFVLLAGLHIYSNFRAVSCLVMSTLNTARLHIVLDDLLDIPGGDALGVPEVNKTEPVMRPVAKGRTKVRVGPSLSNLQGEEIKQLENAVDQDQTTMIVRKSQETLLLINNRAESRDIYKAYIEAYTGWGKEESEQVLSKMERVGWTSETLALNTEGFALMMEKDN